MACLGYQLKDEPAHYLANASCETGTVRRSAKRPHFCLVSIPVTVKTLDIGMLVISM
jgi:hypothetical protein